MYRFGFYLFIVLSIVCSNTNTFAQIVVTDFNASIALTTGKYPIATAIADIDGDGHLDILVANEGGLTISIFRNTAAATSTITPQMFASAVTLTASSFKGPENVLLKDIDGDGKVDLIVSNNNGNTISVFRNTSVSGP